ncbi:hypothetical protein ASE01_06775 [Nocardioides sp. Root190]|uniref:DUF4245 family protein n=1 Tax=Nocardioides sp. Root190 TaxID=1736488 RepID=UPI0006FA5B72|nr:DUF4245 family protein [Nocardioides sp. Root190]KRB77882.1 hypothetical protein ASE01_06775 [Nocardioides sp. Root190]
MSSEQAEPTGRPGRYNRSAAGLVSSLVVTVLGIGAVLYFMSNFRNDFEATPESIDYLATVESAQQAGLSPVYPAALPEGWIATRVDVEPGDDASFQISLLTEGNRYVGIRLEDATIPALLAARVDEKTEPADGYTVPDDVRRPVARTWKGYTDDGGDTAYAAERGDETVLVYGSASAKDLQSVIDSLSTEPLG